MELFVSYQLPKHEEVAFNLAKEFGLTCLFQGDIDKKDFDREMKQLDDARNAHKTSENSPE